MGRYLWGPRRNWMYTGRCPSASLRSCAGLFRFVCDSSRLFRGRFHSCRKLQETRVRWNVVEALASFRKTDQKFLRVEVETGLGVLYGTRVGSANVCAIFQQDSRFLRIREIWLNNFRDHLVA